MLTIADSLSRIMSSIVPGLDGVQLDLITVVSGVLVLSVIVIGFDLVKSALLDGVKSRRDKKAFEDDEKEYAWLAQNDEADSDEFHKHLSSSRRNKIVNKWSK